MSPLGEVTLSVGFFKGLDLVEPSVDFVSCLSRNLFDSYFTF